MSSASTSVFAPSANARLWPEDARPLAHLLSNWARRTRDQLMELLETSAPPANAATATSAAVAQEEYARREKLFHWLTLRQRQLGQLYALLHWTMQNHGALQRVQEITQLLQRRQQMMWTTTDMLSIIHKRAEDSLSVHSLSAWPLAHIHNSPRGTERSSARQCTVALSACPVLLGTLCGTFSPPCTC
jgi:hypothetical protein